MQRNGKIARLPREIRDELNTRLAEGEPGGPLLEWLNGLPAVKAVLERGFDNNPITKQNLSEWRTGGFVEWEARQETLDQAREMAADAGAGARRCCWSRPSQGSNACFGRAPYHGRHAPREVPSREA